MMFCSTRTRRALLAATICSFVVAPAFADEHASTDLDTVVVTATRTAQTQDETLASVTVIDREQIERLQPASLTDLLRGVAGVTVSNNGGPGKASALMLRGSETDHVLLLIDGVKMGSATLGGTYIQDLPLALIERIEIVRGPFSSLYGSEAIGGVVQIFTRRPKGSFAPYVSVSFGSHHASGASAGFGGSGEHAWGSLTLAYDETDGFNACRGFGAPRFVGCYTDEPDIDGYRNRSMSAQGGYRFNAQWEAEVHAMRAEAHTWFDGSTSNETRTAQQTLSGRMRYKASDAFALSVDVGSNTDLSDNFYEGAYVNTFDTHRRVASMQADIALGGGLASVGMDWQREHIDSNATYPVTSRWNRAGFLQWQQSMGAHSVQASVRRDDNEQFGGKTTGSALWGWDFTDALRLTASYGTAYKAPTFNELYYPQFGNPALRPETSRSSELGLRGEHEVLSWSLNVFQTEVENLIAFDPMLVDADHPYGGPNNIGQARIRGAEITAQAALAEWTLRGNATWLDPRDSGNGANHGNLLPRRAQRSARLDADRRFGDFSVGATAYAVGARYDDPANTKRLAGYATLDLRCSWQFSDAWRLQAAANNVTDRRYETAAYYNQPGRNYQVTLRYHPSS